MRHVMDHGEKKLPWEQVVGLWGWGLDYFSHGKVSPYVFFPFVIPMASNNVNLEFSWFKLFFWFRTLTCEVNKLSCAKHTTM